MSRIAKALLGGVEADVFVARLLDDYERRREERKSWELGWRLCMNFVAGNQYCYISPRGEIADEIEDYGWRGREVYNHLAPILETRLAKLSRVRPRMSVVPASGEDEDVLTARTATDVLDSVTDKLRFDDVLNAATAWSETCGTAFYKVAWEDDDVGVYAVPPFEIYPDAASYADLDECESVIHAQAVAAERAAELYGIEVSGRDIAVFAPDAAAALGRGAADASVRHGQVMVYEYYERPSGAYPEGRTAIVADRTLVHLGPLPYRNGSDGARCFPFVEQVAIRRAGCLWGASVIERAIPVQRAYNAVKNRKHEFLNRLAGGVLTVEDGSVDTDSLGAEGLSPGRVLVYRQGATPPRFLDAGHLPGELAQEEDKLLSEFIAISGVSELMRSSSTAHSVNSGVALQLLVEQDDTRLAVTAEQVKAAIRRIAAQILRLYKQYATRRRMARVVGTDGGVELRAWSASDITSDDVVFVTENQLSSTPAQKQQFVFELLKTGLLQDEAGRLSNRTRAKLLEMIGFGVWESGKDIEGLQRKRAMRENAAVGDTAPVVRDYDDHGVHIEEHTKFLLGGECARLVRERPELESVLCGHLDAHRRALAAAQTQGGDNGTHTG